MSGNQKWVDMTEQEQATDLGFGKGQPAVILFWVSHKDGAIKRRKERHCVYHRDGNSLYYFFQDGLFLPVERKNFHFTKTKEKIY